MIVTCTSCSKRYLVDARVLGPSGRTVRCASCGNTWFLPPPADAVLPASIVPEPSPAISVEDERRERRVQLPAVKRSRGRGPLIVWSLVGAAIVAAVWGLIVAQDNVVRLWPPAAKLYAMIGRGQPVAGTGLELRKVTPSRGIENGTPILAVDGEVVNVSTVVRDVPKLRVALRDGNDHELQVWTTSVTDQRLLPGASVSFHTTITQPAEAATGVVVSFASPGE